MQGMQGCVRSFPESPRKEQLSFFGAIPIPEPDIYIISLVSNTEPPGGQHDHRGRKRNGEKEMVRERSLLVCTRTGNLCYVWRNHSILSSSSSSSSFSSHSPLAFLARLAFRVVRCKCCFAMAVFQLPLTRKAGCCTAGWVLNPHPPD